MKGSKLDEEKYSVPSLRRKGAPGSVMKPSPVLKEMKSLKKCRMLHGRKSGDEGEISHHHLQLGKRIEGEASVLKKTINSRKLM